LSQGVISKRKQRRAQQRLQCLHEGILSAALGQSMRWLMEIARDMIVWFGYRAADFSINH
jgi:hypothetical protein